MYANSLIFIILFCAVSKFTIYSILFIITKILLLRGEFMEISIQQLKKLQQIELKMLEVFIKICDEEKLHYYLLGGTLLGAVRHKGFIPWDDDIDVGMPRVDYERFLLCASKYLPKEYFLQTYKTDKEYPYPFAKIRDNRTLYKERLLSKLKINHGVWIDIFPLDFCSPHTKILYLLRKIILQRTACRFVRKMNPLKAIAQVFSYIVCPSWEKSIKWQDRLIQSQKSNTTMLANFCGSWGRKENVPTEWYGEGTDLSFEHLKVKGPAKYHNWLTNVYGDYMKLPPEEKRIIKHSPLEIKL